MIPHPIPPVFDSRSRILLLGSFPSVKSREVGFFYGHPRNRLWHVLAAVLGCEVPTTVEDKRAMLLTHGIAMWDVLAACDIRGSADSTIRNAVPCDLAPILAAAPIGAIFTNGATAHALFERHLAPKLLRHAIPLPSTSPANAAWSTARLTDAWRAALSPYLT